jgi:hypothetical protein
MASSLDFLQGAFEKIDLQLSLPAVASTVRLLAV